MKQVTLFILCLLNIHLLAHSQTAIKWQNTIGGNGNDVLRSSQQTNDGGYIIGGLSYSFISGDKTEDNLGITDYWVVKLDSAGNIEWQNTIGGSDWDALNSVQQTEDGGYILGGESSSGISGDKTESCKGNKDYWLIKLDDLGTIQWQKTIGGSYEDRLFSVRQTTDAGYILGGTSYSNISGDKTTNSFGQMDYWIIKTDSVGNILWQNTIGGSGSEQYVLVEPTTEGGYIVGGLSTSNISGNKTEACWGGWDYWVVKLDSGGNITWQNTIGGNFDDQFSSIIETGAGEFIVGGFSYSDISGDKTENSKGINDYWVLKLNSAGNIIWQKTIGGNSEDDLYSIDQTDDGGYILGGESKSEISGDKTEHTKGDFDYWIVKVDSLGDIQWQNDFGGNTIDHFSCIQQTADGEYFAGGWSYSPLSADKTENSWGGTDFWLLKLSETYNLVTGKLFFDLNSNSTQDAGEPSATNRIVAETTTGRYSFSDPEGVYEVSVLDTGDFEVTTASANYFNTQPPYYNISFAGNNETDTLNDFAFQPAGNFNDLKVVLTPLSDFNPGFDAYYSVDYSNVGTTYIDGTVVFYPDVNLTYISSSVTPDIITADSIVWNTGILSPFQSGNISLTMNISANVSIGATISASALIEPLSGDADTSNNHSAWDVIATGSFDPNEILVDRKIIDVGELDSPPYLEYIINFQNTGTDTATTVVVSDRLPLSLDISSLEFVASSSTITISYEQAINKIAFHFQNILLPDSNVNEAASHGFIRYRIKPVSTLLAGDSIVNNSLIVFDFNPAIHTNDAITQIVVPTIMNGSVEKSDLVIFPNPSSQTITIETKQLFTGTVWLVINDIYGREMSSVQHTNGTQLHLDVSQFPAGIYMVHLLSKDKSEIATMIKE